MIKVIDTESENPICQHCEKEIHQIFAKRVESSLGVRYIYFCAKCKKTLGLSHRKGFWMG